MILNHSLHSSCYTASFSNLLNNEKKLLDDELLFGLSQSFNFMYNYTKLPQSGWTFSVVGSNHQGLYYLSSILGLDLQINSSDKEHYLETLQRIISENRVAIIEISVREYMSDSQTKELFSYIKESNVNHYVTVHKLNSKFVYFRDNFSFKARKLAINEFLNAVYPKNEVAVSPSEGRIFYFKQGKPVTTEISITTFLKAINYSAELFLLSNWENSGLNGLKKMALDIELLFEEDNFEKNKILFYYFCILAGNGGLYRRDYVKFLKRFLQVYPQKTNDIQDIISLYVTSQKKWRKLAKEIASLTITDDSFIIVLTELKAHIEDLILIEETAMQRLWVWSKNNLVESDLEELKAFNLETQVYSLEAIVTYFQKLRMEFELTLTRKKTTDLNVTNNDRVFYWIPSEHQLSETFFEGELNYCFKTRKLQNTKNLNELL